MRRHPYLRSGAVFVRLQPGGAGPRVAGQLQKDVTDELSRKLPGVRLTFTAGPPDNFAQAFEAAPGEVALRLLARPRRATRGRGAGGGITATDERSGGRACGRWLRRDPLQLAC